MTRPPSPGRRRGRGALLARAAVFAAALALTPAAQASADVGDPAGIPAATATPAGGPPAQAAAAAPPPDGPPATAPAAKASAAAVDLDRREIRRARAVGGSSATRPGDATPEPMAPNMDLGRVGLALSAVVGLILFLRWGSRKLVNPSLAGGSPHLMQVVARTPLAPRQQLLLVRVGRRLMVIGDSGGRLTGVGQIDDPDEVAALVGKSRPPAAASPAASFGGVFRRLTEGFGKRDPHDDLDDEDDGTAATATATARSERQRLLDTLDPHTGGPSDDGRTSADAVGSGLPTRPQDGLSSPTSNNGHRERGTGVADGTSRPAVYSEADAEAAVEAARADILALRARLREVTDRLGGQAEAGEGAAAEPGPSHGDDRRSPRSRRGGHEVEDPEA